MGNQACSICSIKENDLIYENEKNVKECQKEVDENIFDLKRDRGPMAGTLQKLIVEDQIQNYKFKDQDRI